MMQPLGDAEELRCASDNNPPCIDPETAHIGQQRVKHLGDACAARRGIHAPYRASSQARTHLVADLFGPAYRFSAADRKKPIYRLGRDVHFTDTASLYRLGTEFNFLDTDLFHHMLMWTSPSVSVRRWFSE